MTGSFFWSRQTDAFVEKMHAKGLFDAAMFENIKECIDLW